MYLRACAIVVAALCLGWTQLTLPARSEPAATFEAAEAAYIAGKFDEARRIYAATAASGAATPRDRAASLRQLAIMAWRLDGDNPSAERLFADALRVGADLSRTHRQRARFYATVGRNDEGVAAADAALATAANATEHGSAALALGLAVLAPLKGKGVAAQTPKDEAGLARARDRIAALASVPPLALDQSAALLEIALRLDDGPLALLAWRSYAREGIGAGAWAPAARRLGAALPHWRRGALTPALRAELFEALATSHFFDLAVMIAQDERIPGKDEFLRLPRFADVAAYTAMMGDMRTLTDAYYRDVANRKADAEAWRAALLKRAGEAWAVWSFDRAPAFSPEAFVPEVERRFGAYVSVGKTGGIDDLHYGHIFIDDARTIEQYGRKAQIRRIALDRMVSNGYESWVWDGRQAHGGWARTDRVYQVRPGYVDGALGEWDRLTDPKQRAEEEERTVRLSAGDDEIARRDPAAYLPGLAARLDWQGLNGMLDRLRTQRVAERELKQAFIIAYNRIGLDANFFAHEGRHVLDKQAYGKSLDSEELEFRAKLSEIAFSEAPRFSFGPIVNPNIADPSSPHGRANKRIMQGLVAWMDKNRRAIVGLDPARPLLPQLDKLTDDQMRAAMRSMDPWARN
jgi:hypothetical protein